MDFSKEYEKEHDMRTKRMLLKKYGTNFEGLLPNQMPYVDAMKGVDSRPQIAEAFTKNVGVDLTKASSISALTSGTTDLSLIPVYVDPAIADLTRRLTPLVELMPRVTNYGKTADYNQLTARGAVGWLNEDAALAEANDTFGRKSTAINFCYSVGRVTGPYLAASRQYLAQNYVDGLNLEIRNKTITLKYIEEDSLLNGAAAGRSSAYGGNTYGAGLEPDGIRSLISTNKTNVSGALTLPNLRTYIRGARTANDSTTLGQGDPNVIVTDFGTKDTLKGLLTSFLRYTGDNYELPFGIKTMEFDGIPVLASKFMPATTTAREVLVLSLDTWQQRVLQDATYEELAKTNDSYKFMVKQYLTTICTAEQFNARAYNIT